MALNLMRKCSDLTVHRPEVDSSARPQHAKVSIDANQLIGSEAAHEAGKESDRIACRRIAHFGLCATFCFTESHLT